jgi:hypothetical protein
MNVYEWLLVCHGPLLVTSLLPKLFYMSFRAFKINDTPIATTNSSSQIKSAFWDFFKGVETSVFFLIDFSYNGSFKTNNAQEYNKCPGQPGNLFSHLKTCMIFLKVQFPRQR